VNSFEIAADMGVLGGVHLFGRKIRDDLARFEKDETLGQVERFGKIMRDEKDGFPD